MSLLRWCSPGLCLLPGLLPLAADALEVRTLAVSHDAMVYHVVVEVRLDAPIERVRAALLNPDTLPQLDPGVKAVRADPPQPEGRQVVSEVEDCVLGFCRRLLHAQWVESRDNEITARTLAVPGSSFRSGVAHWQLLPEGEGTRLVFTADTEPDVWLPPFIGPRLLIQRLEEKTRASLIALERIARE